MKYLGINDFKDKKDAFYYIRRDETEPIVK
jgi:hypothetical protein